MSSSDSLAATLSIYWYQTLNHLEAQSYSFVPLYPLRFSRCSCYRHHSL